MGQPILGLMNGGFNRIF